MADAWRVLVVEDDEDVRALVVELLERAGYRVRSAGDGRSGLRLFHELRPDLVVLDVSMPELDGFQTLERIRDLSDAPVLMLTAHNSELERVRGLKAGADDYLGKPFGRQELVARVEALLRRTRPRQELEERYGDDFLEIDFSRRSVTAGGEQVSLTPLEFRLLGALVRHPDQVLSSEQLLEQAWGDAAGRSADQVKLYVSYLRRKLSGASGDAAPIETVRGFGYRYRPARALIRDS
ncbi:MAG: response regulator transcription factor [Solirubrobacteraceae bacterium]